MRRILPTTIFDLPWEPKPLVSIVVIECLQYFYRASAPHLPPLERDYIILF